jgi:hypothetical protein
MFLSARKPLYLIKIARIITNSPLKGPPIGDYLFKRGITTRKINKFR